MNLSCLIFFSDPYLLLFNPPLLLH